MGLFSRKKEKTHFERDEEGRVVETTRNGVPEGETRYERVGRQGESVKVHVDPEYRKAKSGRQLEQEYYKAHPEKRHPTLKKIGAGVSKLDKRIVDYNRRSNIMNPQRTRKRVARPVTGFGFNPPGRSNANPFGSMFDTGLPRKKPSKRRKTQYKVIGGKAYPIAGTGAKKKKKSKSKQRKHELTDPFNFSGW